MYLCFVWFCLFLYDFVYVVYFAYIFSHLGIFLFVFCTFCRFCIFCIIFYVVVICIFFYFCIYFCCCFAFFCWWFCLNIILPTLCGKMCALRFSTMTPFLRGGWVWMVHGGTPCGISRGGWPPSARTHSQTAPCCGSVPTRPPSTSRWRPSVRTGYCQTIFGKWARFGHCGVGDVDVHYVLMRRAGAA